MGKRTVWCWFLLAAIPAGFLVAGDAGAQNRVTVHDLESALAADHAGARKDAEEVVKLASMAPSERISDAALGRLIALSPGPHSTSLLRLLAEASLFQPPPAK